MASQIVARCALAGTGGASLLGGILLVLVSTKAPTMVAPTHDKVTSPRSLVARAISLFHGIWPLAVLIVGLMLTVAWTALLAWVFVSVVQKAF